MQQKESLKNIRFKILQKLQKIMEFSYTKNFVIVSNRRILSLKQNFLNNYNLIGDAWNGVYL